MGAGEGGLRQLFGDPSYPQRLTHTLALWPGWAPHRTCTRWEAVGGMGTHLEG